MLAWPPEARAQDAAEEGEDLEDVSLESLLGSDRVLTRNEGSFGTMLQDYGVVPFIHGYAVSEFYKDEGEPGTFDLHYFNILVGANYEDLIFPEAQFEYEHGGDEITLRFGQVDVRLVDDALFVRAGLFLVPFGTFNEYRYPEFIAKTSDRPYALREIVPVSWSEVGVQARGTYALGKNAELAYALYVVNGLEQRDDPTTPEVDSGGSIRDMRDNHRDKNHGNKAVGGHVGVALSQKVKLGVSGYRGAYTVDGLRQLSVVGVDARYSSDALTLETELVSGWQEVPRDTLHKYGGYFLVAYKVTPIIEPVIMADFVELGEDPEDLRRLMFGVNLIPFPERGPSLVWKTSYAVTRNGAQQDSGRFISQLALGF